MTTTPKNAPAAAVAKMSEETVRAEFAKLQAKKAAQKARRQTPEFKAKQKARNAAKREHIKSVLAEAAKLGLK